MESAKLQNEWQQRDLAICAEKQGDGEAENEALRQEIESLKERQKAQSFWLQQASTRIDELKAENEALKASPPSPAPEIDPLEVAERHKRFKAKYPKSKATYSDFMDFLKMG